MESFIFSSLLGAVVGALLFWIFYTVRLGSFRQHALLIVRQAESEAEQKKAALALEIHAQKSQHEAQLLQANFRLQAEEQQLKSHWQQLKSDVEGYKKDQVRLHALQKELEEQKRAVKATEQKAKTILEETARLTHDEARTAIIQKAQEASVMELERQKKSWQQCFESECRARAVSLLMSALERKTQDLTKETFLTEIPLKDRSFIPKCIGKDGRNIQTLEELLHVSFIIEEQIPRLLISAHDVKARFLAKTTIERLIAEEKVTPVTIRTAYEAALASFSRQVEDHGKNAMKACGYLKPLPHEVMFSLGQLSFRSSAGQNVLAHSIEVSEMMGILAEELGLKSDAAKAMGLFHDIGKSLPTEWGDSHALAGKAFLQKWGIDTDIANAVASHHGEEAPVTEEARLLPICDRLSAGLPGIRHQNDPAFLTLVQQCEECTKNLPDIISSWAHYAGGHIELIVRHNPLEQTENLLKNIQEAILAVHLPLPVHITLVNRFQSKL